MRRGRLPGTSRASCGPTKIYSRIFLLPVVAALTGCSLLPAAGPTQTELLSNQSAGADFDYNFVTVDSRVVAALGHFLPGFDPAFRTVSYAATNALANGDVIAITVYETGGSSLFPPPAVVSGARATAAPVGDVATGASNIPPQVIEADGAVYVPFVGRLKVAGLTPSQAGELIQRRLEGKAVSPQVLVSLVNNIGNSASVGGEVNVATSVPLSSRGERLLDVIARAGGAKYPPYETNVQLVRGNQVGKVLLQTILNNPTENIRIRPGDQVYLIRDPRTFAVFGATQKVSVYPFLKEKVSLAEAIATAGGPIDSSGNPSAIFLFRFEPWDVAKAVLEPTSLAKYERNPPTTVPVLYKIDMRDAHGYFLSQAVQMRDKDIVLITNAEVQQLNKAIVTVLGAVETYSTLKGLR
jgi:polysaccharide export outer membrane protein